MQLGCTSSIIEENRWRDLPLPLLEKIFGTVHLKQRIFAVPFVCKSWYEASRSPLCWTSLNFEEIKCFLEMYVRCVWLEEGDRLFSSLLKKLAELGGAFVTVLVYKVIDSLDALAYFADRCSNLKHLHLSGRLLFDVTEDAVKCLKQIFAKWKDLEFLHYDIDPPLHDIFPVLGENCKKLGVLIVTGQSLDDHDAAAIVKFLPRITRLELSGSYLSRESLLLILRGCKELQLLSVAGSVNFDRIDEEIMAAAAHLKTFDAANILYLPEDEDEDDFII